MRLPLRPTVLLLCLVTGVASAQQPSRLSAPEEPPPSSEAAPPDEPDWATPPPAEPPAVEAPPAPPRPAPAPAVGPAEPAGQRALRYSRFSAGPGGPSVVLSEVLLGLAGGGLLGSAYDTGGKSNNLYLGAMLGGLTLGTAATFYQYFFPVGRGEAVLSVLAALAGLTGGIAIANDFDMGDRDRALLGLVSSQAGLFASLLLTAGGEDVSGSDMGLMTVTTAYAFLFTGLFEFIRDAENPQGYNYAPVLLSPLLGMAIGGLLSFPLEMSAARLLSLAFIPLGPAGMAIALAAPLAGRATAGRVVLITLSSSFVLTALIISLIPESPRRSAPLASTVRLAPVPVLMAAGRDNGSLAAGPGLWIQF